MGHKFRNILATTLGATKSLNIELTAVVEESSWPGLRWSQRSPILSREEVLGRQALTRNFPEGLKKVSLHFFRNKIGFLWPKFL